MEYIRNWHGKTCVGSEKYGDRQVPHNNFFLFTRNFLKNTDFPCPILWNWYGIKRHELERKVSVNVPTTVV